MESPALTVPIVWGEAAGGKTIHKTDTYNTVGEANQEAGGGAQGVVTVDRVVRHDLTGTSLGGDEERALWISRQEDSRRNSKVTLHLRNRKGPGRIKVWVEEGGTVGGGGIRSCRTSEATARTLVL